MSPFRPLALGCTLALLAIRASAQLIAYFPFENNANDASAQGHLGTAHDVVFTPSGHSGFGARFNGTSSYVELATINLNPTVYPQLTMGAWVKASDVSPIRQLISHDDGGFDRSLGLDFRGEVTGWSAFVGAGVLSGTTAIADEWSFVAVVFDQTAATATLYVNDQMFNATGVQTGPGWDFTRIGMNPSFGEYFSGTIDDVFFFGGALTTAEITRLRVDGIVTPVPEPSTYALFVLGIGIVAVVRWRARGINFRAR